MVIAKKTLSLSEGWKYRESNGTVLHDWQDAQSLPTSVHLDLLANHAIPDPFQAKNEELVKWIATRTWIYEKHFTIFPQEPTNKSRKLVLVFEGLDTYTTVKLDGKAILETDNMFLSHRVDITEHLVNTKAVDAMHTLQITFHNAEQKAAEKMEKHSEYSWFSFHFGNKRLAVRKAQYHFVRGSAMDPVLILGKMIDDIQGWDWGPILIDCGPWKPIYLETYEARVADLSIRTQLDLDHQQAVLRVSVEVEGKASFARIDVEIDGTRVESRIITLDSQKTTTAIRIRNPKLWWPWTLGDQNLYTVRTTLLSHENCSAKDELDSLEKKFGIRKIDLVRQPLQGQEGASFFFRVNGVPIFAAGSCWVPIDSFTSRATPEKYHSWIKLAKDTNQVMIRIWGGGIYEHDAFFDACDELGILVWHDFMFACGIYPAYPSFEESVISEVRQNVSRLRHHPSIAVWCGNNEDYAIAHLAQIHAGKAEYDPTEMDPERIRESGFPARLFYEIRLPEICKELIPDIPYWPGSPFGGSFCNDTTVGDIHQWHVWHLDKFPYQDYPKLSGRMITEFGLQSAPHWKTVKQYFPADQPFCLDKKQDCATDEYMVWHNKGKDGPENIANYAKNNIPFDGQSLRGYIYCSQLVQAEGLSTAFRGWRRLWQGPGREYCAGALVWQLNDCWPVTSWSIADHELRPKLAYWTVKRENQPITAGIARVLNNDSLTLETWACNMTMQQLCVIYEIQAWHVKTGQRIWAQKVFSPTTLDPNRSTELGKVECSFKLGEEKQFEWNNLMFSIHLSSASDSSVITRYVNFHEPLKEVPFSSQEEHIKAQLVEQETGPVIELTASVPMKGVYLDFEGEDKVDWDDNGVDLVPGETIKLGFTGLSDGKDRKLRIYWLGETGWQSKIIGF
ncbi:glycoside hydrolase superfamily [Penicillium frequentans]|uniref:beta-mannosidase n=1 Tax=Penicillium frequentans TaxID=3151616 RepID=A0AAD6GJP7_9EURO|nr:glycoside hydrolase superfamily [Penicillium glabrum]